MSAAATAAPTAIPDKVLTPRGYSILKTSLSTAQRTELEADLLVTPKVPKTYAAGVSSFRVWLESPTRYYLPAAWATRKYGAASADIRSDGERLPTALRFGGALRPHQVDALAAFRAAGRSGIICLPCGYGKTFTGIAAATADPSGVNTAFLIVVHKEFLADQWATELQTLVPGIRIGRVQGEKCDIGPGVDVAIAMIQTLCSRTYPAGTFDRFGFAIFDEVHHLGAEHFSQALQRINCKRMLGLTATPKRTDGLSKVFEWYLGPIVYQITRRPKDDTVIVEALKYSCADDAYCDIPTNWKGETVRAVMINKIAEYAPRTEAIMEWIAPICADARRRLLILSDRREHLVAFETAFRARGFTSIGYYVGGMKQKDLDVSATQQIILGTFAMASEGMNIPTLNTVLLSTPKSNIEQSVGRILRQRKEERSVQPLILDVVDTVFKECYGQWNKRSKFYKECGYVVKFAGDAAAAADAAAAGGTNTVVLGARSGGAAAAAAAEEEVEEEGDEGTEDKEAVPLFIDEEDDM
jgi:superfamily II DNA or RNA helicase